VWEGETLAGLLGQSTTKLTWNQAFRGEAVVTPGEGEFLELPSARGAPSLTLLPPAPK